MDDVAKTLDKWQFGDFQTPSDLAARVVEVLKRNHHIAPDLIIEPTCGKGAFVRAALSGFAESKVVAFEVNPDCVSDARASIEPNQAERISIEQGDFFLLDWEEVPNKNTGSLLFLGNPPKDKSAAQSHRCWRGILQNI